MISVRSATAEQRELARNAAQQYARITSTFPVTDTSTENLKAAVVEFRRIAERASSPEPAFVHVSRVLQKYPQPVSSDMWLTLIDSDHTWRSDSTTRLSELYRYHEAGTGQNTVQWEFTGLADGTYEVQTDWLSNEALTDQGRKSPAHAASYTIYSGATQLGAPVTVPVRANDTEILAGAHLPVRHAGWNYNHIAGMNRDVLSELAAESQDRTAAIDSQRFMRRAVIMSERINAVSP